MGEGGKLGQEEKRVQIIQRIASGHGRRVKNGMVRRSCGQGDEERTKQSGDSKVSQRLREKLRTDALRLG